MISKAELLGISEKLRLSPHVVEKDYALGWALAGIYAHPELQDNWVFKGGTCLKKCYFETYRFSEDLDFTLPDHAHLDATFLKRVFSEIADWIYEKTGLEFPANSQDFDIYVNPRGNSSCQGRLSYRGPISPRSGGLPRIKLDLIADERLVLAPVRSPIFHPYSDVPEDGIEVLSYAYVEAFAEKVRALAERTRPRDLYDVINLYRNESARPSSAVLLDVLRQKCDFKGIGIPRADDLDGHKADLDSSWANMLAHQLPDLPPVGSFWDALHDFFAWLRGAPTRPIPAAYTIAPGESVIRERTLHLPVSGRVQAELEIIRFSAANQLCVKLDYIDEHGRRSTRTIEPYSLRRTLDNNFILHAWNVDRDQHRSYRVDRIQGAQTTNRTFTPRYAIELTPTGPVSIPPTAPLRSYADPSVGSGAGAPRIPRPKVRRPARRSVLTFDQGPTYIYQCGLCGKKFRRKTMDSKLNRHKSRSGFDCLGRIGLLVDTRY